MPRQLRGAQSRAQYFPSCPAAVAARPLICNLRSRVRGTPSTKVASRNDVEIAGSLRQNRCHLPEELVLTEDSRGGLDCHFPKVISSSVSFSPTGRTCRVKQASFIKCRGYRSPYSPPRALLFAARIHPSK